MIESYVNAPKKGTTQLQGGVAAAMDHAGPVINENQQEIKQTGWVHTNSVHPAFPEASAPAAGCITNFDPPAHEPLPPPSQSFAAPAPQPSPNRAAKGHYCLNGGTQNQGNILGDRSCVRQSKLYRQYESGNSMKAIFGHDHLAWDTEKKEGAYAGQSLYDHNTHGFVPTNNAGDPQTYQQPTGCAGAPSRHADTRLTFSQPPQPTTRPATADKRASYDALHRPTCPW